MRLQRIHLDEVQHYRQKDGKKWGNKYLENLRWKSFESKARMKISNDGNEFALVFQPNFNEISNELNEWMNKDHENMNTEKVGKKEALTI